jgi:hypothetical protein
MREPPPIPDVCRICGDAGAVQPGPKDVRTVAQPRRRISGEPRCVHALWRLCTLYPCKSGFAGLLLWTWWDKRIPGSTGFWGNVGKPTPGRRIRNADEVLTGRALNLASRETNLALERLVAVRAIELEFGRGHKLLLVDAG